MAYADLIELHRRQPRRLNQTETAPRRAWIDAEGEAKGAMTGAASFLAYLGAAPLVAAALVMIVEPESAGLAERFMTLYGAALIIFFGGVRWGVAVMKESGPTMRALLGAGIPLVAALPILAPGDAQLKMIAIMGLMIALLLDDLGATRRGSGAPAWYLGVRLPLTVFIEVAFLVALAAGIRG